MKIETDRTSELTPAFPRLAPILDMWFDPGSTRGDTRPRVMRNVVAETLKRQYDLLQRDDRPGEITQRRELVIACRGQLEDVLRFALRVREGHLRHRPENQAADEAINGYPQTVTAILSRNRVSSFSNLGREMIAMAHLVYVLKSGVYPDNNEQRIEFIDDIPYIRAQQPKPNAQDAVDHFRAGLSLLAMGLK